MPRSGSTYYLPAGSIVTDGVDDILATQHNTPLVDIAADLNAARPIAAGGTGATTAEDALVNLGAANYATRAAFVTANNAVLGLGFSAGKIVVAAGFQYRRSTGSTAISDLNGWVPNGDTTPQHFGAVANGSTDDAAAFSAAIDYLNTLGGSATMRIAGNFAVNGSLTAITQPDKTINGYGGAVSHNGGTLFTFSGSGASRGAVLGLRYVCPTSPTSGTTAFEINGANQCTFRDITGTVNILLKAGLSSFVGGYTMDNVQMSTVNGTQKVMEHGDGANAGLSRVVLTAIGTSRVLDETTPTGATAIGIHFGAGGWDTGIFEGLLLNGYLYGLQVDRTSSAENVSNFKVSNSYFDFCANGIELKNTASGGGINNWTFVNCWAVGMDGYGVRLTGSVGSHRNIQFSNVFGLTCGKNSWRLDSAGMDGVLLSECVGWYSNRLNATNTGSDQDDFVALAGGWQAINCNFGKTANNIVASSVPNWQARYGATIAPNIGPYRLEGCTLDGVTGEAQLSLLTTTPSGNAHSCTVINNRSATGAAAVNYATTGTFAAPTSTVVQTNLTPFALLMSIFGGTVTQVQHKGLQIGGSNGANFTLRPGETWRVDYSSAPTIAYAIEP